MKVHNGAVDEPSSELQFCKMDVNTFNAVCEKAEFIYLALTVG